MSLIFPAAMRQIRLPLQTRIFAANVDRILRDGVDFTLASTGSAPFVWNQPLAATGTGGRFSLLSTNDLSINQAISSNGQIFAMAGWDKTTGLGNVDGTVNLTTISPLSTASANITIGASGSISSSKTGNAITLVSDNGFY